MAKLLSFCLRLSSTTNSFERVYTINIVGKRWLSLNRCQNVHAPPTTLFANGGRILWFQNQQNKNILVSANLNQRNISLFGQRRTRSPSIFMIGFAAMTVFLILEFIYDQYRLSGLTLSEFLASWFSKSPTMVPIDDSDGLFSTKYASILLKSEIPDLKPSRIVPGTISLPDMKLTLFQYQNCPFCSKLRIFLDYYGLPYDLIEVNPVMRQQIKFSKKYHKVPILLVSQKTADNSETASDDDHILQINDSTLIISALNSYLLSRNPKSKHHGETLENIVKWYLNSRVLVNPLEQQDITKPAKFLASKSNEEIINRYFLMIGDVDERKFEKIDPLLAKDRRWRRWVDDHLVHVLSPNIYRTWNESVNSFKSFAEVSHWDEHFSQWEIFMIIYLGATAMYLVGKRLKKKYGLKEDVRQSLYDSCNYWLKSIGPNQKFMGGDQPSLSDLTVFGVLSSIERCEAFDDLIKKTKISDWYYSMKSMVEHHNGAKDIEHLF